jgi:hypothetical protein
MLLAGASVPMEPLVDHLPLLMLASEQDRRRFVFHGGDKELFPRR